MKKQLLLLLTLFIYSISFAQNGINQLGAKPAGMGYTYAAMNDKWSQFNNPGGMAYVNEMAVYAAFENKYAITGLNSLGAAFVSNIGIGTAGVSAFRFGDDLYNEQILSATYSNKFGIAGLGVRANYVQYTIEEFGTKGAITLDFGGVAQITELIRFGAYVRNINQAKLAELNDERIPTLLNTGLAFLPMEKLTLAVEVENDIDLEASFKVGLEYRFLEKFYARTGIKTNEFTNYFGLGFISQKLQIDYALTRDQVLGFSHQASLAYIIKKP